MLQRGFTMNANTLTSIALSTVATLALGASTAFAGPNDIRMGTGSISAYRYINAPATRYTPAPRLAFLVRRRYFRHFNDRRIRETFPAHLGNLMRQFGTHDSAREIARCDGQSRRRRVVSQ
jgi:hypothetical protein